MDQDYITYVCGDCGIRMLFSDIGGYSENMKITYCDPCMEIYVAEWEKKKQEQTQES